MSRLTRRVGLIFQRILLGDDPRDIPVAFQRGEQLTINMETARAIQFYPDWNSLTEAELLYEEEARAGRRLTLGQAVDEAVTTNIDLAVADRTVAAGEQDIREARSLLKPQLEVSSLGLIIDEDRAEGSFGTQAERTLTGSITLNQLLYEDSARANVQIQQHLQDSRELGRERVRSDIAQEAATAYLNILKAQTFMQIQKDNLKLTRSNLELARTRKEIGISGPAEVYRWESQIAIDKGFVLEAQALESRTRIALNRILKRPLEEPFITVDVKLGDPLLITSDRRIMKYIDNPWTFGVFRDFMVREGLKASPELKALTAAIGAQERSVLAAKRDYTSPTVGLEVDVTQVLSESGKGSQGLPGGPDDTDWSVGVSVSLPLATGGARDAELQRASEDLEGLRLEYQAASDRVEQRIRSALHIARASFADIQLAQDAAESAQKNLDLVTDSYARGVVSITELLDAQEAVLRAELAAANAVYDFMIDLIEVERSVNRFGFFVTPDERNEWFDDLKLYFISRGEKVPE